MKVMEWRYWNANGFAVAVVGAVTLIPPIDLEGSPDPFDWAAYIGATEGERTCEKDTVEFTHKSGCKLSERIARAFFPQFSEIPYRC